MKPAEMNETGASTGPQGRRYGRSASGFWWRRAPRASGAPAYIRTVAEVMKPTRLCQPGNGRKSKRPIRKVKTSPKTGTFDSRVVFSKMEGTCPFLLMPNVMRLVVVV